MYKPLKVEMLELAGISPSMLAMRLPKGTEGDSQYLRNGIGHNDSKLASNLIKSGDDHAKAMRGVVAYLKMEMQVGFMIEFETYRHGVECLSTSSSMHGELSGLKGAALAEQKQKDLVEKVYTRIVMVSYQALRNMYKARRKHRHPDWRIFCRFIESLPYFDTLIYPEG